MDGYDGIIVPQDNERCAEEISKILKNQTLKNRLIENTYHEDYSNKKEMRKLYDLMGEDYDTYTHTLLLVRWRKASKGIEVYRKLEALSARL